MRIYEDIALNKGVVLKGFPHASPLSLRVAPEFVRVRDELP